jgi:SAM-dependent methyltransferase
MSFRDQSLDGIICCEVLEHVPESRVAMEEIGRILKPEGRLAVSVLFFYPLHGVDSEDRGDYWRFAPGNLKILLHKDFELLRENRTHMFFAGDPFVVNIQTLWKRRSS